MMTCPCCNQRRRDTSMVHIPSTDEWICNVCLTKSSKYFLCELCDEYELSSNIVNVEMGDDQGDMCICPQCLNAWNGRFRYCAFHEVQEHAVNFNMQRVRVYGIGSAYLCDEARDDECYRCNSCGEYILCEDDRHIGDDDEIYCSHCLNNDEDSDDHGDFYEELEGDYSLVDKTNSNTFNECLTKLTYGLELETSHIDEDTNYTFSRIGDGSINGMEYVSPILNGDKGFMAIETFLSKVDADVDSDCGYHLHIGFNHIESDSKKQTALIRSLYLYKNLEKYFFEIVKEGRAHNSYCISLSNAPFKDATTYTELDEHYESHGSDRDDKWHNWRYYWTNFHSFWFRETLEIRLHHGTLNYHEITNWVNLHGKLIEWCSEVTFAEFRETINAVKSRMDFLRFVADKVSKEVAEFYYDIYDKKRMALEERSTLSRETIHDNVSELLSL